jgi:hypothetical protein
MISQEGPYLFIIFIIGVLLARKSRPKSMDDHEKEKGKKGGKGGTGGRERSGRWTERGEGEGRVKARISDYTRRNLGKGGVDELR